MTVKELFDLKQDKGYSDAQLANLSGVPICMIRDIFSGECKNPTKDILQTLEKALAGHKGVRYDFTKDNHDKPSGLEESAAVYHTDCSGFTLDDYYALPDERRVELIDGVFYDMAAPSTYHQTCILNMSFQIKRFIDKKGGRCKMFFSPVDVQLECDSKTMVQPDLIIVCDPKKIFKKCIVGAPDFIVEILSESTGKKDMTLKLAKYRNAGVREYWLVDLEKERVLTYFWDEDEFPHIYGANDRISVGVYGGELMIDMNEIFSELRTLYAMNNE